MGTIYEEAVAEAKTLRRLALENATAAVTKRIEPRLKAMIDEQLLREDAAGDDGEDGEDDILLDLATDMVGTDAGQVDLGVEEPAGVTLPDEEGKVTIDLDDFVVPDEGEDAEVTGVVSVGDDEVDSLDDEAFLSNEAVRFLRNLLPDRPGSGERLQVEVKSLTEAVNGIGSQSGANPDQISQLLRKVKQTYFVVREATGLPGRHRDQMAERLESLYEVLKNIEENKANMARKRRINEEDLRVTIAGLPDDVEADELDVDVDMEDAEDDGEGPEDEGEDLDLGDLDLGEMDMKHGKKKMDELDDMMESDLEVTISGLPDDVEADELDVDVDMEDEEEGDEGDLDMGDMEDELDDDEVVEVDETMLKQEVARIRRMQLRRLREETAPNAGGAGVGADEYDDFGDADEECEAFVDMDDADLNVLEARRRRARRRRMAERRARRQGRRMAESRRRRPRAATRRQLAETKRLRRELAEANLFNAKMVYANKLLQKESLSEKQKARIVESLDAARSVREVKLVYRSLTKSLSKPMNESRRRVRGSASRATGSGSARRETLNEGASHEARWAKLAGIDGGKAS